MRYLTLLLLVTLAGCGQSEPQPEPIEFDFRGVKIGDPVPEFAKGTFWVNIDGNDKKAGSNGFQDGSTYVRVYSIDDIVHGISLHGDEDLLTAYKKKYGQPHFIDSEGQHWNTTDGVALRYVDNSVGIITKEYLKQRDAAREVTKQSRVDSIKL